mgnify:CR=1 FL=1
MICLLFTMVSQTLLYALSESQTDKISNNRLICLVAYQLGIDPNPNEYLIIQDYIY